MPRITTLLTRWCFAPDHKIVSIPFGDPTYNSYRDIKELPSHIFEEIKHFFRVYKTLENKETVVDEAKGAPYAIEIVNNAIDGYIRKFRK